MTFRYRQFSKVIKVWNPTKKKYIGGVGKDASFEDESLGWHILIDGSNDGLHVGPEQPDVSVGDTVEISVRKVGISE